MGLSGMAVLQRSLFIHPAFGSSNFKRIWRFEMHLDPSVHWTHNNITKNFPPDLIPRVISGDLSDPFVAYIGTGKGVWQWVLHYVSLSNWKCEEWTIIDTVSSGRQSSEVYCTYYSDS